MITDTPRIVMPEPAPAYDEQEGELIWMASESQVTNLGTHLLCLLTFWLVLPALYAAYRFMVVKVHVYRLSNQRLRESSGLLFKKTEELELYRVKDISVEQPFVQRLFGLGRVVLRTSDRSTPIVVLNAIPSPLRVADLLRNRVEHCRLAKGVREID